MRNVREQAYGHTGRPRLLDRLGGWLSERGVRRWLPDLEGKTVADVGCGYEARLARTIAGRPAALHLFDVTLSPDLERLPGVRLHPGPLPAPLGDLPDASVDVVMCISVLEHLRDPRATIAQLHRVLAPGGVCLINVPSWRGKAFLEISAFRLGFSTPEEMDDHKMYYDPRDLWPLLVEAGFRPSALRVTRHKLGLNTFAVARK
jgi:SAM-dependent methyltransferase